MSGTVTFDDGTNSVALPCPRFGYKSILDFPFDSQELDDGTIDIYDHGASYDKRWCECAFELTQAQMESFASLIRTEAKGRAQKLTMTLSSNSGFHPFMPDKGDGSAFTVAVDIINQMQIDEPFLYHLANVRIVNCGSWPVYSIPAETNDGTSIFQIGSIANLRFPPNWFQPTVKYNYHTQIMEDGNVQQVNKQLGDYYSTSIGMVCNETKAAKLIEYLAGTARATQFTMKTDSNFFAFGNDKSGNATYQVKLNDTRIECIHPRYNSFEFNLPLIYLG